jgi:hypothetical protein
LTPYLPQNKHGSDNHCSQIQQAADQFYDGTRELSLFLLLLLLIWESQPNPKEQENK